VDRAKALLEKSELAVDTVSWKIGYEDVAFFNRLFKRITGLTPGVYRRKFRIPFATGA
jgi:transcriptional regulator GlxA family with amidase domain